MIKQGADGPAAVLFAQGGTDPDKVFAAAHEHCRHASGHLLELIHFLEVVVQHFAAQMQPRSLRARNRYRLIRVHAQASTETLFEQARQALGAFTQRTVEGAQLIGQ